MSPARSPAPGWPGSQVTPRVAACWLTPRRIWPTELPDSLTSVKLSPAIAAALASTSRTTCCSAAVNARKPAAPTPLDGAVVTKL